MKKNLLLLLLIGIVINTFAQVAPDKYYIQFTNKAGSIYSIDHPEEFLTQRAIDRRNKFDIDIVENDIPVNSNYIQGVADVGVDILNATRWLNGVTIYTTDPSLVDQIKALPYVSSSVKFNYKKNNISSKFSNVSRDQVNTTKQGYSSLASMDYGYSLGQIEQLNGIALHNNGYKGEGMVIAVLDAGFSGALEHPVLAYLWDNNKILGSKDFVYMGGSVFNDSEHGKMVLSCIGANLPGEMIGTAPEAEFWLLRSEEAPHENIIEEYNWMSAAEYADSVGADVINSSLGYIDFDNPAFNHNHGAMNGDSTVITRAADFAASKGILVVNSAGNSGGSATYPWIGAPADGDSVLSIGAVNITGQRASFSSIGPTADGRIKPNVMACGEGATIAVGSDGISTWGNGTSFSSPILAGMATCLWQAHPEMTIMEIQEAIKQSGSNATTPDDYMGWGIPDFQEANSILTTTNPAIFIDNLVATYPNPFNDFLFVEINNDTTEKIDFELFDVAGNVVYSQAFEVSSNNNKVKLTNEIEALSQGIYFLKIRAKNKTVITKVIKAHL